MNMRIALTLMLASFSVLSTATAHASAAENQMSAAIPKQCPLSVDFGSYGAGTDGTTFAAVQKLLSKDRGVAKLLSKNWGREGEILLCAVTRSQRDARRLFKSVKSLLPRAPRGPITLKTSTGLIFTASRAPL